MQYGFAAIDIGDFANSKMNQIHGYRNTNLSALYNSKEYITWNYLSAW